MRETELRIAPAGSERDAYLPLLLLADESETAVRDYYQQGDPYALADETRLLLGMILAIPDHDGSVELKAVAVDAALHGQGIGKGLLAGVLADLKARGVKRVVVGTGNADSGLLAFYQKAGFRPGKSNAITSARPRSPRRARGERHSPARHGLDGSGGLDSAPNFTASARRWLLPAPALHRSRRTSGRCATTRMTRTRTTRTTTTTKKRTSSGTASTAGAGSTASAA